MAQAQAISHAYDGWAHTISVSAAEVRTRSEAEELSRRYLAERGFDNIGAPVAVIPPDPLGTNEWWIAFATAPQDATPLRHTPPTE